MSVAEYIRLVPIGKRLPVDRQRKTERDYGTKNDLAACFCCTRFPFRTGLWNAPNGTFCEQTNKSSRGYTVVFSVFDGGCDIGLRTRPTTRRRSVPSRGRRRLGRRRRRRRITNRSSADVTNITRNTGARNTTHVAARTVRAGSLFERFPKSRAKSRSRDCFERENFSRFARARPCTLAPETPPVHIPSTLYTRMFIIVSVRI